MTKSETTPVAPDAEVDETARLESEASATPPGSRTWLDAVVREVRTHVFGYSVLAVFLIASPFAIQFLFPQATPAMAVAGGLVFAVYAALCAVPHKFL